MSKTIFILFLLAACGSEPDMSHCQRAYDDCIAEVLSLCLQASAADTCVPLSLPACEVERTRCEETAIGIE